MRENVWKEQQYQLMYRTFKINPFKKQHLLTEKAMPQKALEDDEEKERVVVTFLEEIRRARLEPRKKYTHPQTSSQEIGWYTSPLVREQQHMCTSVTSHPWWTD
ncbi:cilia- and flagella-associated protein 144 isoform X2 [Amia ocellicauda]|uniref:cilia- and flagella-associated protein 144 isoform X2 n=1 Tax=Amia ocellicauda TaxID=2972642 RepID=UPI00346461D3